MKILLAYVIWNKVNMIHWLCTGIVKSFDPKQVDVYFLLDDPIDGTDEVCEKQVQGFLPGFNYKLDVFYKKGFKTEYHNVAIKYALDKGYDWVIFPQDDQKIQDPFLVKNLLSLPSNCGVVGGRDGFNDLTFTNAYGSLWSVPTAAGYQWLKPGEWKYVRYINDGPIIYNRRVMQEVGYQDLGFKVFALELDMCRRAEGHGMKNIVLGTSIAHEKLMCIASNLYYERYNYGTLDWQYFREKYNNT